MNYFYERSKFSEFKSNTTYHQLLSMTDDEFGDWARLLRKEVTEQWDERGTPPVIGRDEEGIIEKFKKLKSNPADYVELKKENTMFRIRRGDNDTEVNENLEYKAMQACTHQPGQF